MRRTLTATLCACLLAGCGASPERRSGAEGAAVGGLGAALVCKLAGGNDRTCAGVGVLAAGAGAVVGYQYAERVQKRRAELAGRENDLDARIAHVRRLNDDTDELNRRLAQQVEAAERDLGRGRLTEVRLASARTELDARVRTANEQLQAGQAELEDMKRFRSRQPAREAGELDAQIARLERSLAEAQRNTTSLASLRQRI